MIGLHMLERVWSLERHAGAITYQGFVVACVKREATVICLILPASSLFQI